MNALSSRITCAPSLGDGVSDEQCLEKFGSLIEVVESHALIDCIHSGAGPHKRVQSLH
jgi:hypothetical protein